MEVVADGLVGPTQVIAAPDGENLWVAQLNGGESDGDGQVLAVDTTTGDTRVLLDGLLKPTGIAILDGHLWVMLRRSLVRYPLPADGDVVDPTGQEILFEDLPFNGRSEGTLVVRDGQLVWITSGQGSGVDPDPESGVIWLTDPAFPSDRLAFARGFKNAYSMFPLDDGGRLLVGEVGEPIDGGDAPADELNVVSMDDDGGWPACSGDRIPTTSLGATADDCEETLDPIALFPPRATPTGVARFADRYLAALWVEQEVVEVPLDGGDPTTFLAGASLGRPQHLLVLDDDLWVTDHETGRLLRIRTS